MILNILFVLTLLISLATIKIAKRKFGFLINHYFLTNLYWVVSLMICIYFSTYLSPISIEVYTIFFVGLWCFNLTILFSKIKPLNINESISYSLKRRRILECIVIMALLPLAYNSILLILSGQELWMINSEYWNESRNSGSYIIQLYQQNIIEPLATLLMATCFFTCYEQTKKHYIIVNVILGFVISLLFMLLTGGGRTSIAIFGYFCILSYFGSKNHNVKQYFLKIPKSIIIIICCASLFMISWASTGRGSDLSLQEILTKRLALFAPIFEYYYYSTDVFSEYTLGLSMTETIAALFLYPFKMFGIIDDFQRAGEIVQNFVYIPKLGSNYNAGVSAYFYYMRDFGIAGVIIGPILVANIYNWLYKCCMKTPFLTVFYFTGILNTCLGISYPFGRGFIFMIIFVFMIDYYLKIKTKTQIQPEQ